MHGLANHKKHKHQQPSGIRSIVSAMGRNTVLSATQLRSAREVEIKFILRDIIANVVESTPQVKFWPPKGEKKKDGRAKNKGTSGTRRARSAHFKRRVITEFETLKADPALSVQAASIVTDLFDVNQTQVNTSVFVNRRIAYQWDIGWFIGFVRRRVTNSDVAARNGQFAVKYDDSASEKYHELFEEDYGPDKGHRWLLIRT